MDSKSCCTINPYGNIIGPDGVEYSLKHLAPSEIVFDLQIKTENFQIPLWVVYRDHCYSRDLDERKDDNDHSWLLPKKEQDKNRRRLFCRDRWVYSHGLPELIRLVTKSGTLYRTTQHGLYYKLERSSKIGAGTDDGMYLFFKFSANRENPMGVRLSVESVHERITRPSNDRGRQSLKFWTALREFVEKNHPQILDMHRQQKGP
jgi:hypothetical protein